MRTLILALAALPLLVYGQDFRCRDDRGEYWSTTPCRAGEAYPQEPARPAQPAQPTELQDGDRSRAMQACEKAVERLALRDFRWQARGWTGGRWAMVIPEQGGRVVLAGDQIELQNGLGAWIRHKYVCAFDLNTGRAEATAEAGRL